MDFSNLVFNFQRIIPFGMTQCQENKWQIPNVENQKEYVNAINYYVQNERDAICFYLHETVFLNTTQFYQY